MNNGIVIQVRDLHKSFKGKEVLKGITFNVYKGEIFSLLGPNGAGKTTTVKVLSCVLKPSEGYISVFDYKVPEDCKKVRENIGVMPQDYQGFMDLTVRENIEYFVKLYNGKENKVNELISMFKLDEVSNEKMRNLSGGYRRRVGLASAFAGNQGILFLDEPTVGLDPKARREFWELLKRIKSSGVTILLTTHYLDEAQKLADRVGILYKGNLVKISTPEQLLEEFKTQNLEDAYLELINSLEEENGK
ncbi:ABC transporter ATP-binding protein [Sulfolobus sp. A20]|uniref:ABC transporter ATP-binding protein n=1 Tax=Sulfolobaceae TaxID=118883 RepID=UPI0008462405|nr:MULTISPECIES: ABC transporter ATP-binding protein [unclassified Sulfolobus]TRM77347.1 ABC transporter ATP-binding protein [Sulfolobus sp. A20-N-F8]TRM79193.1 ABC transporter ATP-binding protein [Sulfolobus sp. B5]TRM80400.1 ABC transporter ATP-binding protein [Sulfolobus sp. D5]TRM94597.1 ABC transporter ATP-binding protein [Sulfolobus sp. A20-N-G8]TRN04233.1 ABC transporter ATP-binding protein [Sulfolobus sp. E1]